MLQKSLGILQPEKCLKEQFFFSFTISLFKATVFELFGIKNFKWISFLNSF